MNSSYIKYVLAKILRKLLNPPAVLNCKIHPSSRICSGSHIVNSAVGRYSYIGNFSTVIDTVIGGFCSIADGCVIGGAKHPISWVSTSPVFHAGKNIMKKHFSYHEFQSTESTIIGNDVWIGSNSMIKSGVKIGNGVVVGMGSVVTKDIEDYAIVAGNPAKLIRKRFDENTIQSMKSFQWWNLDDREISKIAINFDNPEIFKFFK